MVLESLRREVYGEASLTMALEDIVFPCTKDALLAHKGDEQIVWMNKKSKTLRELLKHVPTERFESMSQLVDALNTVQ